MSDSIRARIRWLPSEAGGRQAPPLGPRYTSVARFAEEAPRGELIAWGIVAEFDKPPRGSDETVAHIRFLVPPGPVPYLHPGSRFELFEGEQVVAQGEVLAETEPVATAPRPTPALIKEPRGNAYMSTAAEPQPSADALRAELAEKEEQLRKLVRHIDQISRTEFRDRAARLKAMRAERDELEKTIDGLKTQLQQAGG